MSTRLDLLIPELQAPAGALIDLATRAGVNPRVTSTLRTTSEQARLYRRFLSGASTLPAAPPGTSAHEYGYAFDMVASSLTDLYDLGSVWTSWGGVYGSDKDPVHFEYPGFRPPPSPSGTGQRRSKAVAPGLLGPTLGDVLVGFLPGVGSGELIATVAGVLGLGQSEAIQFLSAPVTTLQRDYPELWAVLSSPFSPLFFLQSLNPTPF